MHATVYQRGCLLLIILLISSDLNVAEEVKETVEICDSDMSNGMKVIDRTSSSFTALINYNCSSIDPSELIIFFNETFAPNCFIHEDLIDNHTINITCDPIENNAGRNWTFTIVRNDSRDEMNISNETFTITLTPLSLTTSTNLSVDIDNDVGVAEILIANCLDITDPEFLVVRCNSSDLLNNTLSDDCTYICSNLEPGSIYHASLIRLPVPIADQMDRTFPEETLHTDYTTDLDKATNLTFNANWTMISFSRPRGYYDEIEISCTAVDQYCASGSKHLVNSTTNCFSCTSILISPVTKGVSYECQAITIKANFGNTTSDMLLFNTSLEAMIFEKSSQYWFSYSNQFTFNVTAHSDFDYIHSYCSIDQNETSPCSNITIDHEQCSTILNYKGVRGCSYQCYFITKKINYLEKYSTNYTMELRPPKPNLYISGKGSRSILITWTFDEPVYARSYKFLLNRALVDTLHGGISSYNYTNLLPNQIYELDIILVSNQESFSEPVTARTLEEAPPIPSQNDINNKIIPLPDDANSNTEQFVMEIDLSLFSNQYGTVHSYNIYVRQDQRKNTSKLDAIGSYSSAMKNESLDYLSFILPLSTSNTYLRRRDQKLRLIIGEEQKCQDETNATIPCNGKLKADKNYKIVINACANAGCTSVLSKAFRTSQNAITPSASKGWVAIFPVLFVLIVILLGVWKREQLKSFYLRKMKKSSSRQTSVEYQSKESRISLNPSIIEMRPKALIQYVNMTHKMQKSIYAEYEELENITSQHRQTTLESTYKIYDRYRNISARGSWNRTAVRLIGEHRMHDYINANEIKSYDNEKLYIACQGPLKDTCQDFWDMIVQYNVSTIVMLTKTDEPNPRNPTASTSKCYQYFPTNVNQSLVFDQLVVKVVDVEFYHNSDLEIRHLIIKNNGVGHRLIHYFYTGWPDYNIVEPKRLLDLIETINKHTEHSFNSYGRTTRIPSGPIVVHCSAGVGRTGVYIAVETIVRLLDRSNRELQMMKLDVMGIVYRLRKDRGKMVQTKEQYMLINRCVEEQLRRNRALDSILKRVEDVQENGNLRTPRSSNRSYLDLEKLSNRTTPRSSTNDPSTRDVSMTEGRSLSSRSSVPTHETNGHRHRISYETRQSSGDPIQEEYHPATGYEENNDETQPPIPPRRSRSRPASSVSEQYDA